jgi:cytochrome c oxidase cbb3-type subunit I/II
MEDSVFDHPFQWGSKRTGPDLARVGGRYSNLWHYHHMIDPREISPGSNMPSYAHLVDSRVSFAKTPDKLRAMRTVGVPYTPERINGATQEAEGLAARLAGELKAEGGVEVAPDSELVALIAYLQRLGRVPADAPSAVAEIEQPASDALAAHAEGN